jgi:septal ring factor EnvC (AmiA/AmiB activator)
MGMMPARGLALAGLVTTLAVAAHAAGSKDEELRELRARLERAQRELAAAEESRGEARDELRAAEKAVSDAHRSLFELGQAAQRLEGELAGLAERSRQARAGVATEESAAEKLLRLQYQQRAPDRLRLVLEGRDAAQVARHLQYLGYIQRARAELIVRLRASVGEVEALEREALARRAALAENQAARAAEAARLERERRERAVLVERLAVQIAQGRREVGRLKRDEARLTRLVEELARALAAKPEPRGRARGPAIDQVADASLSAKPFASLKGRLKLPVRGELAALYGSPRDEGGSTWKGIFIRASTGDMVRAVADGRVVYADWLRGFGNLLILDHGSRYMSLYAYNEGLLRQVGEAVRSGDAIAQVGASGGVADSGLYFELRLDGKPFDPMRWAVP